MFAEFQLVLQCFRVLVLCMLAFCHTVVDYWDTLLYFYTIIFTGTDYLLFNQLVSKFSHNAGK